MMGYTAILVVVLFAAGTYLILQEKFSRILFGFILFSNAANLFVLSMAGNPDGKGAPVVLGGGPPPVDPLPQALVLTAIVIGFGVIAYLVMLLYWIFLDRGTTRTRELYDEAEEKA